VGLLLLQSLHKIIFQDFHKVVTLLEYVGYHKSQLIQRHSVKVMELFRYVFFKVIVTLICPISDGAKIFTAFLYYLGKLVQ